MAERSKQLAKDLLEELDKPMSAEREAYEAQKEREDRESLERFYVQTGQKEPTMAAQAIAELIRRIEALPSYLLTFEEIEVPFTLVRRKAVLRFAPSLSKPGKRYVELTVWSPSGLSHSSQWLKSGSSEALIAHLRRPEMWGDIYNTAEELMQSLERDGMA